MAVEQNSSESLTDIELFTRDFAATLNEKDRRRFVALQAKQYGHGGIAWITRVVGCSRHTVEHGMRELEHLAEDPAAGRVRRPGAGRKKRSNRNPPSKKT